MRVKYKTTSEFEFKMTTKKYIDFYTYIDKKSNRNVPPTRSELKNKKTQRERKIIDKKIRNRNFVTSTAVFFQTFCNGEPQIYCLLIARSDINIIHI